MLSLPRLLGKQPPAELAQAGVRTRAEREYP